jgi:outer membrane protein
MRWPGDCIANAHAGDPQAKARFPLKDAGDLDFKDQKEFCNPMKRSTTLVCLLVSAAGVGSIVSTGRASAQAPAPSAPAPAAPAPAQSAGLAAAPEFPANPKIAIIAFQQAVAATNEGQRNFAQLRTKFEPKQAALKAQSDEIDSLKKQLQDAGANLSEPERDSRLRTIDEKTKSLQRTAEDAQNEASGAMNDMYQQLAQKVYAVLDAYSNQNKFTIVLDTSAQQTPVLWANQGSDITKAVVDAYNAKSGVPAQPAAGSAAPRPSTPATPGHSTTPRPTPKPPQ